MNASTPRGRYDNLINDLGGPSTPAVGFAFGDATLEKLLMRTGAWPDKNLKTDYYVIQVGDTRESAIQLAHALRNRGNIVETDVSGKKFTSQLNYSNSINTETVIIVGERDLKENKITIKKMSTGEELQVSIDDFPGDYDSPTYDDFASKTS